MKLSPDILRPCWVLAGPTAVGKSAVALVLAEKLGAEIVALDSMTVYRGMDIGTAKPSRDDQSRVPHHLLDIIEPHEDYSLAEYLTAAEQACREIFSRGKTPLFVGGTGLYLRGLLRGVFDGPAADWEIRRRLETEFNADHDVLYQRLQQVDPGAAQVLHARDTRRIIRALEVYELTGRPLSEQQREAELPPEDRPKNVFWLSRPRDWLYQRMDQRVDEMFSQGLIAEVQQLQARTPGLGRTASQGLGYKEVLDYLSGTISRDECRLTIQTRTRQFAKRQHTWFRNLSECRAVEITGVERPEELAERLLTQRFSP